MLFLPVCILATLIGNPSTPALLEEGLFVSDESWSNPQVAYSGDFLFQKKLLPRSDDTSIHKGKLEGISQLGEIAWCIRERFLLQGEFGSGDFKWHWNESDLTYSGRAKNGLIWNASAKLLIFEVKDSSIAVDGHVGGWEGMKGSFSINGNTQPNLAESHFKYWQFAVGLTQRIKMFAPYIGVAVNQTRFQAELVHFRGRYTVGPFLGVTLTNGSRAFLNFEWRGWFEEGLSLTGQIRF